VLPKSASNVIASDNRVDQSVAIPLCALVGYGDDDDDNDDYGQIEHGEGQRYQEAISINSRPSDLPPGFFDDEPIQAARPASHTTSHTISTASILAPSAPPSGLPLGFFDDPMEDRRFREYNASAGNNTDVAEHDEVLDDFLKEVTETNFVDGVGENAPLEDSDDDLESGTADDETFVLFVFISFLLSFCSCSTRL